MRTPRLMPPSPLGRYSTAELLESFKRAQHKAINAHRRSFQFKGREESQKAAAMSRHWQERCIQIVAELKRRDEAGTGFPQGQPVGKGPCRPERGS